MWKKSKLVLLSSALAFSVTYSATNFTVLAADNTSTITEPVINANVSAVTENVKQNYVKVMYEGKVLFHEQVPTKTMIQVLNPVDEVLESEVLSGDTEMELEAPKIEKGYMLSYWSIEREKDKLIIKPIVIVEKEVSVSFYAVEGGKLLEDNAQTTEIVKSVNNGTNLKDVLPEVNPEENHKFSGWFKVLSSDENGEIIDEKLKDIDDIKVKRDVIGLYYAKFYPDYDNDNIDDRTQEITVKFVTNSNEKFKDITTTVGKQMSLPVLKKKDSIFLGWYTDEEYKNKFTGDVLTESVTLYAKWEKADKVIAEAQKKPITDKDISNQVEQILNDRLKGLNNSNNASQTPKNPSNTNSSGLTVQQPSEPSNQGYTSNTFKETKYVFDNKNLGQVYMVKFFDENDGFLFSLTLPYGKTIRLYDENDQLHEEYAIRQETTITINSKDYINEGSFLIDFDTREVRVNSMQITEVFPNVKVDTANEIAAYEKAMVAAAAKEATQSEKKQNMLFAVLVGLVIALVGLSIYFMKKRKRKSQEQVKEIESI